MNTSSIWPSRTSTTAALRREARKPTAYASASTKPSCRSSIRWRSANASTPASSCCSLTLIPGSPGTTNSDHIRGAGATAKRQCKPSLTPSHSPGRNHWPHDVGQTQPFRHQTGQLSDQVSASTAYYPDAVIAGILNRQDRHTAYGHRFTANHVSSLRRKWNIPGFDPPAPLPEGELLTVKQAAAVLGTATSTIHRWLNDGFGGGQRVTPGAPWSICLTEDLGA